MKEQTSISEQIKLIKGCPWCGKPGTHVRSNILDAVMCVNPECVFKAAMPLDDWNSKRYNTTPTAQ